MSSGLAEPVAMASAMRPTGEFEPSDSQREAIEAALEPLLVLAGPGAGKTFCLTERIRFLIERLDVDPARICAFTFTNKAAGEIDARLAQRLGARAHEVKGGTIHAYCAELLREFGEHVGLRTGFGIADESYQRTVLRRLGVPAKLHKSLLGAFTAYRFRGAALGDRDATVYERYQDFFAKRNIVDFDMLVMKTAALLAGHPDVANAVRARWDCVLVDEFQDLNPEQYTVIRELAREHRIVFAVGDDEQSIYSWTGADPRLFKQFLNDFEVRRQVQLRENRRCCREVFDVARRLVTINTPLLSVVKQTTALRDSGFDVVAHSFADHDDEVEWIIEDLKRERAAHGLEWGDFALLYRKHAIGYLAETRFLTSRVPCRLAEGRAFSEDPVIAYLLAALRVIAAPTDAMHRDGFLAAVLPANIIGPARARASEKNLDLDEYLDERRHERGLPEARKLHRAFYALMNLSALATRHASLVPLVEELLSHRVGEFQTALEEHHDELTDPAAHEEVVALAERLHAAIVEQRAVVLPRLGGAEIGLKGILLSLGLRRVAFGVADGVQITVSDAPQLGLPLAVFKAAQLVSAREFTNAFRDFTAVDLETTGKNTASAEIVEIAAVRVRDGVPVEEFHSLVRPRVAIEPGAAKVHGITETDVADAPFLEELWPDFARFCGSDVLVAHNGYAYDFPILRRMAAHLPGGASLCTYDTLPLAREIHTGSAKLVDLARLYEVDAGQAHRALDDTRTLARVCVALNDAKVVRARKTALDRQLGHLAVALSLTDADQLNEEARLLRRLGVAPALGRYSDVLSFYRFERDAANDPQLPTDEELVDKLGGAALMERLRADRSADQRYPTAMVRLRRLLEASSGGSMADQIGELLERAVLSRWDGTEPERDRVNLLTLHSTKGLEFSRVYVLGAEDAQFLGMPGKSTSDEDLEEARRLLYVGMTRAKDRLVLTRVDSRDGKPTGGHRFLDEMGLRPTTPR